jgi:hypothetical protein
MDKKIYDGGKYIGEICEKSGEIQFLNGNGNTIAKIKREGSKQVLYQNGNEIASFDGQHTKEYMGRSYDGNKLLEIMQKMRK